MTDTFFIMNLIKPQDFMSFVLVFTRISATLFFMPVFGGTDIPVRVRILFALAISLACYPIVEKVGGDVSSVGAFLGLSVKEILIGLLIGFVAKMTMEGIVSASQIVGYQMGFGTASMFSPDTQEQANAFDIFHRLLIVLLFFSMNLHHLFFEGLLESFAMIKLGSFQMMSADVTETFIRLSSLVFVAAMKIAAPVVVALLFSMAILGLLARAVPQMNIFVLSFPLSFFLGMLVYLASFPYLPGWIETVFSESFDQVRLVLTQLEVSSG